MTEQEAFEIACLKAYPSARSGGLPKMIPEIKDFEKGWDACKDYVKQGQEPVAHVVNPERCTIWWNDKFTHLSQVPKKNTPLYLHPAPKPDVSELVEAAKFLLDEVGHLGNASPVSLTKLKKALAKVEGKQ